MKRISTFTLAIVMAVSVCQASSSIVAPGVRRASMPASAVVAAPAGEIVAAAPVAAPAVTAASPAPASPARLKATDIIIPLGSSGNSVNLQELSTMSVADLEKATGKKMNWLRRVEFKLAQRRLRHSINPDGTLNNKRLSMLANQDMNGETGFHIGGFALGLLLFLIGVLIAYLIDDRKRDNRVKWAWIGAGVLLVIFLLAHI